MAFWPYPLWNGNDNAEHVLFDIATGAEQDRLVLFRDNATALNLTVYDTTSAADAEQHPSRSCSDALTASDEE